MLQVQFSTLALIASRIVLSYSFSIYSFIEINIKNKSINRLPSHRNHTVTLTLLKGPFLVQLKREEKLIRYRVKLLVITLLPKKIY